LLYSESLTKSTKSTKQTVLNSPASTPSAIAEPLTADVRSVKTAPTDTAIPPKKDRAHIAKFEEVYKETPTSETKTRTKALCAFGCRPFVYRNVEHLNNHLAAPLEGLGKSSGCKYVKSAAPDVLANYAAEQNSPHGRPGKP
jgi:hypothetical protein